MNTANSRFTDKVALVTGGASGIGYAVATSLLAEGARVVVADIDPDKLAAFAAEHEDSSESIQLATLDATDPVAVEEAVESAVATFSKLDIVVANAGGGGVGRVADMSVEDWQRAVALNLDSFFYLSRASIPHLIRSRGCIVATSSSSGLNGWPHMAGYVAAKAGVVNLVRSAAIDYAAVGVRVNAVAPGPTMTPAVHAHLARHDEQRTGYEDRIPMSRLGEPNEIAAGILFLASDAASYITGVTLPIDGGLTAWTAVPR